MSSRETPFSCNSRAHGRFRRLSMETEGNKRKLEDISKEVVLPEYDTCVHCKRKIVMTSEWAEPCNYHPGEPLIIIS